MNNTKVKALICGFIFAVLFSFTAFSNSCQCISSKIFRLHIIANSDRAEDQSLKIKVRDRILNDFGACFKNSGDLISAKKITEENLEKIKEIAQDEVLKNGYNYAVDAYTTHMYFNNRKYGSVTIPAGDYDALRVTIGSAKGKNWWCVMFPPMCLPAASEKDELGEVLNPSEMDLVEGESRYKIKFKIIEFAVGVKDDFETTLRKLSDSDFLNQKYKIDCRLTHIFEDMKSDFERLFSAF